MGEHQFDTLDGLAGLDRFDYPALLDGLRCRTTEWLAERRAWLVREQRRLRVEELAVTAVLDERGGLEELSVAAAEGVPVREVRARVETAHALEALPEIAAVAHAGRLSDAQLVAVARLAGPEDDAEWARRAPGCAPGDLARQIRLQRTPTVADSAARRAARELAFWWEHDAEMLAGRFRLPDLDGALFESVITQMIERMRPAKGQPWETRARRGADALVELCRDFAHVEAPSGPMPHLVVEVPLEGPARVAGIPLPDEMVETLRAQARIEPVLVDPQGMPIATGRARPSLSPKIARAVRLRDGRCRVPTCDRRHGLEIHHLWPKSWGGTDDPSNLAMVCVGGGTDHHPRLVPHGPWLLIGNPNRPDGLRLVHRDQLPDLAELAAPGIRAGPGAA